jgi:hypothetical protein
MEKQLSSVSHVMEMGRILSFTPDDKTLETAATSTISRQSVIAHIVFMHTQVLSCHLVSCIYSTLVLLQHQDDYQFLILFQAS